MSPDAVFLGFSLGSLCVAYIEYIIWVNIYRY
jgi:hypothetical protein